ncbi:MAG: DUF2141 domain-containing protein [Haliea sp.]
MKTVKLNSSMKMIFAVVLLLSLTTVRADIEVSETSAQEMAMGQILVHLKNFESDNGNVFITLFRGEAQWLTDEFVQREMRVLAESLTDGAVTFSFQVPVGEYAFTVFHDRNDNKKMDTNFIGIPKEPGVLSNQAKARFGPPKYEDAMFQLTAEGVEQTLYFK